MKDRSSIGIIGGGIIGASIAYHLSTKGESDIVVFEQGRLGGGSTSAALGGFRHQFSNELSIRMSKESIAFFLDFERMTGYDPLLKKDGYSFVAESESSIRLIEKNIELQKSLGVNVSFLSQTELGAYFPFYNLDGISGGSLCLEDGHASTLAVLQGFVSGAKDAGIEFYEDSEITGIITDSGSTHGLVVSGNRRVSCAKIVIAAGPYSCLLGKLAGVEIPVTPVPRRVVVTSGFSDGIPRDFPLIINVDSTLAIGREGKGIIIGDNTPGTEGFEMTFPTDYDEKLLTKALERVPALSRASIAYANQGLYEVTPDSNPIISSIPDVEGLYCCAGFSGHGFMHSPSAGRIMTEMLLGEKPHLNVDSFDIRRFQHANLEKEKLII